MNRQDRHLWATRPSGANLAAERFEPSADIHLSVRFSAVVPRLGGVGCLFRPFEDRELRVVTVNRDPPHRLVALLTANLTSINTANHSFDPALYLFQQKESRTTPCDPDLYSSICKFNGSSSRQSILLMLANARFSADDLHGSTVTTNGSASAG